MPSNAYFPNLSWVKPCLDIIWICPNVDDYCYRIDEKHILTNIDKKDGFVFLYRMSKNMKKALLFWFLYRATRKILKAQFGFDDVCNY